MNTLPIDSTKPRLQRGAASVAIAMLIIFILVAAVLGVQSISGTSAVDAVKNDEQVTALFLAESALERTTAIMTRAAATELNSAACNDMIVGGPHNLGTGRSFTIDSATMYDSSGTTAPCVGGQCARCVVQVTGCVFQGNSCVADAQKTTRTLQQAVGMQVSNGSCGFGGKDIPVQLSLSNPASLPTLGFFSIGWAVNVNTAPLGYTTAPGNTDSSCNVGTCLSWLDKSSQGAVSTGSLGAVVPNIAGNAPSGEILMPITENRPYSAVGILFEPRPLWKNGTSTVASPQPVNALGSVSSYWDDLNGSKTNTVVTSTSGTFDVGKVNSGVANTDNTVANCVAPPSTTTGDGFLGSNPNASNAKRCNSWCYGGDTIVMGLSGKSTAYGDTTDYVTFNSVQMKKAVHLPLAAGDCPSYTPPDEYTEVHYLYNPDYISTANTASSGGEFNGVVGIPSGSFNAKITYAATNKLTVNSIGGGYKLFIGDQIYCDSNSGGCNTSKNNVIATISDYPSSSSCTGSTTGCALTGASNTYTVAMTAIGTSNFAGNTNTDLQVNSQYMQTTQAGTNNWLSAGDVFKVTQGTNRDRTIATAGAAGCTATNPTGYDTCWKSGVYKINAFDQFSQNNLIANGYTIHVGGGFISEGNDTSPATASAPKEGTVVAVRDTFGKTTYAGTNGALFTQSCVVSSPAPNATVFQIGTLVNGTPNTCDGKRAAKTRLVTATVCGGTCGLFNDPDETDTDSVTPFEVHRVGTGTTQWAAGFICIKGIDPGKSPTIVTTSSTRSSKWSEVVR